MEKLRFIGSLENESDVLGWMIDQKSDESIEEIDRETLFEYIGSKDFLAVIFCEYWMSMCLTLSLIEILKNSVCFILKN